MGNGIFFRKVGELRALERWDQKLGVKVRAEIQGLACASRILQRVGLKTPAEGLESRIRVLQERGSASLVEKLRLVTDHATDAIWLARFDRRHEPVFTFITPAIGRITGFTPEEALRMSMEERMTPESVGRVRKMIVEGVARIMAGGSAEVKTLEIDARHKDGGNIPCELTVMLIFGERKGKREITGMSGSIRDITERAQAEKEKKRRVRLETSLRTLEGVTDKMAQILSSTDGSAAMLARNLEGARSSFPEEDFGKIEKNAQTIIDSSREAMAIADLVKEFTRQLPEENADRVRMDGFLKELLEVLEECRELKCKVEVQVPEDLPPVEVMPETLRRGLFMVLKYSMGATAEQKDGNIDIRVLKEADGTNIRITDNGRRHDPRITEILRKSPFTHGISFLYVEQLTLALALKYLDAQGASFMMDCRNGHGATFDIRLPNLKS